MAAREFITFLAGKRYASRSTTTYGLGELCVFSSCFFATFLDAFLLHVSGTLLKVFAVFNKELVRRPKRILHVSQCMLAYLVEL